MAKPVSTTGRPPGDQADYWRHLVSSAFGPLHVLPPHYEGFAARILARMLGPVQAGLVEAPAHSVRRSQRQISCDTREYYKLGLVLGGSCVLHQHGRRTLVAPGDVVIYDLTQPVEIFFEAHRILTVVVPHKAVPLPPDQVAQLAGTLLTDARAGRLVRSLLVELAADTDDGPYAHHLGGAVLELVTGAMTELLGSPSRPPASATELLHCIEDWIEHRLADPELSPAGIARAHHISVRQLYRVFQAKGTTVARHIRTRRLEHCRRELRDPLMATQRISAIAGRWCFPDAAAFSRAFRTAYGVSPSDYRASVTGIVRPD